MVSVNIPLDGITIVISNDHSFELDYLRIESNAILPSNFDLIIGESINIGIDESYDSSIELQVGVPYESDLLSRPLDYLNDEIVPIDSIIDVNYDLPMWRSLVFGVDESLLVDSPKVRYTVEYPMVDDNHVQVTIHRSILHDRDIGVSLIHDIELDSLLLRDNISRKQFVLSRAC